MTVSLLAGSTPVILIVDDDEVIRMLMRQFLEGEGYAVVEAEDGPGALEKLAEQAFDLVILDIAMPGIDGPEVCEHIRSAMADPPPVLMVTALDDEKSIERSYGAGAVDYIRKPLRWPVLKNRIRYILGSHRAKQELELLSRNYEMILDAAANGICGVDDQGLISYINPAALKMLGYGIEEVRERDYRTVFKISLPGSEESSEDCCPYFIKTDIKSTTCFDEARMLRKDGTSFPVDFRSTPIRQGHRLIGGVLVFQDVTERQEAAELIRYMANHDPLTNLPNRNYFRRRLPQAISLARRYGRILCLLFIDLDRFKPINDQFGHGVGDIVLMQVAERLRSVLRTSDSVCRLGGDEFVILLESTEALDGATLVAQKVIESLNEPIEAGDHVCFIGASIGISVFPLDCQDAETMLRHADIAMYEAKKKGRNCWQLYAE
ncbi:MAG: diguanylate cyclase [Desulfobulbus sp.]|jgi:diguanylate cyclase (GGDEF)-like protein/PAS domain S-box-containing protein|uniref:diguanylate cyclase domain-containing protein n=1 Tax=Desulfobulbus sp. TaxID=895 RepID=UPI002842DE5C|nr:diguanylate cyclase [Desulfobulbus sp.]MDR2550914.1 diguanylate cyclase [Desulfobulbus sp.]